jgi:hypothetical protein
MPQIRITKELNATCQHKVNYKHRILVSTFLALLALSISGLIAGCILEVRWAIIVGILGIGFNVLGLFVSMDAMRNNYIKSREQEVVIDHVTIIDDKMMASHSYVSEAI